MTGRGTSPWRPSSRPKGHPARWPLLVGKSTSIPSTFPVRSPARHRRPPRPRSSPSCGKRPPSTISPSTSCSCGSSSPTAAAGRPRPTPPSRTRPSPAHAAGFTPAPASSHACGRAAGKQRRARTSLDRGIPPPHPGEGRHGLRDAPRFHRPRLRPIAVTAGTGRTPDCRHRLVPMDHWNHRPGPGFLVGRDRSPGDGPRLAPGTGAVAEPQGRRTEHVGLGPPPAPSPRPPESPGCDKDRVTPDVG